jgi:cell division protein FtsL
VSRHRPFLALWTLAVVATTAAFVLFLAMRSRSMHFGYELGRARAEQSRLREARRVLELEVASYQSPQRVEAVARALLGMAPPSPDRVIALGPGGAPVLPPDGEGRGAPSAPSADPALPYRPRVTPPRTALRPEPAGGGAP